MNDAPAAALRQALEWAIDLAHSPAPIDSQLAPAVSPPHAIAYLLYCSHATRPLTEGQLSDLLEQAKAYNERVHITGLLCYGEGHFVQVLEGAPAQIDYLFARIQRDPRHQNVRELSRGTSATRQFFDWRMAFAKNDALDLYWLISYLEANKYQLLLPKIPILEPDMVPLLHSFGTTCTDGLIETEHVSTFPF